MQAHSLLSCSVKAFIRMDGVPPWFSFIGGMCSGYALSLYAFKSQGEKGASKKLTLEQAIEILEAGQEKQLAIRYLFSFSARHHQEAF